MLEFNWVSLNYIFSNLYSFFMSIVYQFNKPFEDFFTIDRVYNVFSGEFFTVGLPGGILTDIIELLHRLVISIFEPILNIFGLTILEPAWVCILALIPAFVVVVGVIRLVTNVINN